MKLTAKEIVLLLCSRYPKKQWVVASELHTATGYTRNKNDVLFSLRSIDFFAMSLWPSTTFQKIAFEIKVNRTDWLNEIADPCKRAQAYYLCNAFYFVLLDTIFNPKDDWDRSLTGCGLLLVSSDGKMTEYRKPRYKAAWDMPPDFTASFLRNIRDNNLSKYQPER